MSVVLRSLSRLALPALATLWCAAAWAQTELLEVRFDLAQYTQRGNICFAKGGTGHNNLPSARTNYVHATVVWIEDSTGHYMTTLYRWGRTYHYNLEQWATSSDMALDGITESTPTSQTEVNGGVPADVFHAFTTGQHDVTRLPDGLYHVRLETTFCEVADEYEGTPDPHQSLYASFDFTKGRSSTATAGVTLGSAFPFNNVKVVYTVPAGNVRPKVDAGLDQYLTPSATPADETTTLVGLVGDDSGTPTVQWTQVAAEPAALGLTAFIATPNAESTDVTFAISGIYTFRLTATDSGGLSSSNDVTIYVNTQNLEATHDSPIPAGPQAANNYGIIENGGPWVFAGNCPGSEGYFRFDLSVLNAPLDMARFRMPFGEATPGPANHHDFYVLNDADDDWNGPTVSSTDWEATITFNNAPVDGDQVAGLAPTQLVGSWTHLNCIHRHTYTDPAAGPDPANVCPTWVDVDLDATRFGLHSLDTELTILMANRECTSFMQVGSHENLIAPHLLVIEHWQSAVNLPPTADASATSGTWIDADGTGDALVTLDGTLSSDDVGVAEYQWWEGTTRLAVGAQASVALVLPLGVHDLELRVRDGGGLTALDPIQVVVEDRFHPNRDAGQAAGLSGASPPGSSYDALFASTPSPNGDWYAIDLAGGGDLTVDVDVLGGNLDARLLDDSLAVIDSGNQPGMVDEQVAAAALAPGTYYLEVASPSGVATAGGYSLNLTVVGLSLTLSLDQPSLLEDAGTVDPAGTVSLPVALGADLTVTLVSGDPADADLVVNPITIAAGNLSADFGLLLTDNGAVDGNRIVPITATAPGYNQSAADLQILDDDGGGPIVSWARASDTRAETGSPLLVLNVTSSVAATVDVPYTVSGSATSGSDYQSLSGTVSLTGATSAAVLISLLDDGAVEADETVVLTLGSPVGALVGAVSVYTLTITDDDQAGGGGAGGGVGAGGGGGSGGSADGGSGGGGSPSGGCTAAAGSPLLLGVALAAARRFRRRQRHGPSAG